MKFFIVAWKTVGREKEHIVNDKSTTIILNHALFFYVFLEEIIMNGWIFD